MSSSNSHRTDDNRDRHDRHRSRRRSHERKKERHKSRRSSRSRERNERKRDKKRRKDSAVTSQWGKYGTINESDMYNKEEEFRAWLIEEKMINREALARDQERKLFASFVEDYNTATLPHEKYYNMRKYETQMHQLRMGEHLPQTSTYDPNADLKAHAASHKRTPAETETYLSKDQLKELRQVQSERVQARKLKSLGLDVKSSMGVRMDGNEFEP